MARRLRFTGTDSKVDGCPALHTDEGTGEIIVQARPSSTPKTSHSSSTSESARQRWPCRANCS